MQMLACLSKEELLSELESIFCIIENHKSENSVLKNFQSQIIRYKREIREASLEIIEDPSVKTYDSPSTSSRIAFREVCRIHKTITKRIHNTNLFLRDY